MVISFPGRARTRVSTIIDAPRQAVYRAFLHPSAVVEWLPPASMQGHVHTFESHEGGTFSISFTYHDAGQDPGPAGWDKIPPNTDSCRGRFVQLKPCERIVQEIEFEAGETALGGTMTVTVHLAEVGRATEVVVYCDDIPNGVRPADNEAGWRSSLRKLAALVE